ncbi:MAG: hypothetical protein F6K09_26965, partial [Merismopedia sp. SIO2A8]|nr:hypothetical protein [Merismopedia sp. SIO2A8]
MLRHQLLPSILLTAAITSTSFGASAFRWESLATDATNEVRTYISNNNHRNSNNNKSWRYWWDKLVGGRRVPPPKEPFCSIWPNDNDPRLSEIWSKQPLFIWKNAESNDTETNQKMTIKAKEIVVFDDDGNFWKDNNLEGKHSVRYRKIAGQDSLPKLLEPGKDYYYQVTYLIVRKPLQGNQQEQEISTNDFTTSPILFRVMDEDKRKDINPDNALGFTGTVNVQGESVKKMDTYA